MRETPQHAMLLMAVFATLWVIVEYVVGGALSRPYPLMQIVWCRYAVHLMLVLLLSALMHRQSWATARRGFHLLRSLLMLVMPLSFAGAIAHNVPAGTVWAIFWISPLLVLFLAQRLLDERAGAGVWASSAGASAAAGTMMLTRELPSVPALALSVVMALSFSLYVVMTRQLRSEPVMTNLLYTALGVFIVLSPFIPSQWVTPTPRDAILLAGIGVVGFAALYALDRAASHSALSASIAMLYAYLPVMALVMWSLYGVRPSRRAAGGAILIVAMLLRHWTTNRRATTGPLSAAA